MRAIDVPARLWHNLRDLPGSLGAGAVSAAVVAVLMSMTGPVLLVYQAARDAGYGDADTASWLFAIYVGGGVLGLVLSLGWRQPMAGAYSIAGAALLIEALPGFGLHQAVGAYLMAGLMIVALAWAGGFERAIRRVPGEIVMGMLAGVLLRFGAQLVRELAADPWLVGPPVAAFLLARRWGGRVPPVAVALAVGVALLAVWRPPDWSGVAWAWAAPRWHEPVFTWSAFFSLSLPLMLLALSSQNAPGIGILWMEGYRPPVRVITLLTGAFSLLAAPLGGHGVNLAAPMTALCAERGAHPDRDRRYGAAVLTNVLFAAFGLAGATAVSVIEALPLGLVRALAGLALLPVILNALAQSVGARRYPYGAALALLIAVSGADPLGIAAPFWALVGATAVSALLDPEWRRGGRRGAD